jgi:hypothetical protein
MKKYCDRKINRDRDFGRSTFSYLLNMKYVFFGMTSVCIELVHNFLRFLSQMTFSQQELHVGYVLVQYRQPRSYLE